MATIHNQPQGRSSSTAPFAETRDLYRQKYEAQLREWDAKVEEMRARADKLDAQARLDMNPHFEAVRTRYDAARSSLSDIGEAAEETWEEMKRNAEQAWLDFKSSVEGAYDAFRNRGNRGRMS